MLLYAGVSGAAFYKWVDEQGNTHYTTTPPPESLAHEREVISSQGVTLKKVPGRMTVEERALQQQQQRRSQQSGIATDNKRNRRLLQSYRREEDIIKKRDEELAAFDERIAGLEKHFGALSDEYTSLVNDLIVVEQKGKMPSESKKSNARYAKRELDSHDLELQRAKQRRARNAARFEEEIKLWRELKGLN